jgi:hypothetical protein
VARGVKNIAKQDTSTGHVDIDGKRLSLGLGSQELLTVVDRRLGVIETGENWVKELEEDVRSECEKKYGHVVHISLDASSQGDIYALVREKRLL